MKKDNGFFRNILDDLLGGQDQKKTYRPADLHYFTIEKPYCCPARDIVTATLHPIGIPIFEFREWIEKEALDTFAERMKVEVKTFENLQYGPLAPGFLPMAIRATFAVPKSRANQTEYWIWRTRRLIVIGGEINPRNKISAIRHNGKMPRASDPLKGQAYARSLQGETGSHTPMLESSCKQAQALWDQVNKMAKKKAKKKQSRWFVW